jgi:hypothetical protein
MWAFSPIHNPGAVRITGKTSVLNPASGDGYFVEIHFNVVGSIGHSSSISIIEKPTGPSPFESYLFNNLSLVIAPVTWGATSVIVNSSALAPTVTAINPTSGPTAGGTTVTITGTNFVNGATLTIGGVAATGVTFINTTTLTATTPVGTVGAKNVLITNPDTQSGTLPGGFTYIVPASVNLMLIPASSTVNIGSTFDVVIQAEAGAIGVAGVDAFLNFNPAKLAVIDMDSVTAGIQIIPGTNLNTVITNTCNNTTGMIDFSAGKLNTPFPSGTFTIATIRFQAVAVTIPNTAISFSTTEARNTSITDSIYEVLGTLTGVTISIILDAPLILNPVSIGPLYVNDTFSLDIKTNTNLNQEVSGVSAFINFDASKLEVIDDDAGTPGFQIAPGSELPTVLVNNSDNGVGTINFSTGKLGAPYPAGVFLVATIHFRAKSVTAPTTEITFAFSGTRESMVEIGGTTIPGTHSDATVLIISGVTVNIAVALQGGSRPDNGWVVPLTVKFFTPGADVMNGTPIYTFNKTAVKSSGNATAQCAGIMPGNYDITAKSEHTLLNVKLTVVITAPTSAINLGALLEGNANNDDRINIQDFGLLSASFGMLVGNPGYNAMTDFDRNGRVNIQDFGLLSANYLKIAPIEVL